MIVNVIGLPASTLSTTVTKIVSAIKAAVQRKQLNAEQPHNICVVCQTPLPGSDTKMIFIEAHAESGEFASDDPEIELVERSIQAAVAACDLPVTNGTKIKCRVYL